MVNQTQTTAIFDGYCVICQSTRRVFTALDWRNRIEFLDLHQHAEVERRYPDLEFEQMMGEIHVVESSGKVHAGYFGTRRMMRDVPLLFPIWLLTHIPGANWVGQRIYRWVARNRYQINRMFGVELPECVDGVCKIPQ